MTLSDETFVASFNVEVLAAEEDGDRGKVKALVSAYNVAYQMGFMTKHLIEEGAFAGSLKASSTVPVFWNHNWNWSEQPPIGVADAEEESRGLVVDASFFLDNEGGRSVYKANKAKALKEWSIGYHITRYEVEEADDGFKVVRVKEAELLEASSVLKGANPETETLKVAHAKNLVAEDDLKKLLEPVAEFMEAQVELVAALSDRIDALEAGNGVGEEDTVEPPVAQDDEAKGEEPAAGSLPKAPDFLPPSDDDEEAQTEDVSSLTRVLQAWNRAEQKAQESLLGKWSDV